MTLSHKPSCRLICRLGGWGLLSPPEIGGFPANSVVKGHSVLLEEIPQETEGCLETDPGRHLATLAAERDMSLSL